jgi:hypothetical protein
MKKILISVPTCFIPPHDKNWIESKETWIPLLKNMGYDFIFTASDMNIKSEYEVKGEMFYSKCSDELHELFFKRVYFLSKWFINQDKYSHLFFIDSDSFVHPDRFNNEIEKIFENFETIDYMGCAAPYNNWDPHVPNLIFIEEQGYFAAGAAFMLSKKSLDLIVNDFNFEEYQTITKGADDWIIGDFLYKKGIKLLHNNSISFESKWRRVIVDPYGSGVSDISDNDSHLFIQHYCNGHMREILNKLDLNTNNNLEIKINFILDLQHNFNHVLTGGIVAMHYLSYLLAKYGHNVYIFCKPEYEHVNITQLPIELFNEDIFNNLKLNIKNSVVIYPEITKGNPLNAKHVVRWLLYNVNQDVRETYTDSDFIFPYGNQNKLVSEFKNINSELIAMNFYFDKFENQNKPERKGFCHIIHKHTSPNADFFLSELGSTNLSDWKISGSFEYLNREFNNHEYFICYDQLSFWPQIAALCGCKVIVMNTPNNINSYYEYETTPEQYKMENPLKKYGIAFGFDDLQWSINTLHLVEDHLKNIDNENKKTVENFIKFFEKKLNK